MKRILSILFILALCTNVSYAAKPKQKAVLRTVVYITDLDCEDCAKKIRENVSFEKGVKDLKVSVEERTVEVKFDESKNDTLKLRKSLNKLGYQAKVLKFE